MDITAGQRGGLDKVGSRSLPRQEKGQDGQPKIAAEKRCYLQLCVELRGFEPLTPSMRTQRSGGHKGQVTASAQVSGLRTVTIAASDAA